MSQFQHFTSLPPEQEAQFLVYEQRAADAQKSGLTMGVIFGLAIGILLFGIFLAVEPDHSNPMEEPAATPQTQTAPKAKPMPVETTPTPATTPPTDTPTADPAAGAAPAADPAAADPAGGGALETTPPANP